MKCYHYLIGKGKHRVFSEYRRGTVWEEAEAACFVLESARTQVGRAPPSPHALLRQECSGEGTRRRALGGCGELRSKWVEH